MMKKPNRTDPVPAPKGPISRRFQVDRARDKKISMSIEAEVAELDELAAFLGIPSVASLTAKLEIVPLSRGRFDVTGEVKALLTQTCVVSLEDFETTITEPIEAIFAPPEDEKPVIVKGRLVTEVSLHDSDDPPDPIIDGAIDLGAIVVEFLALGLDPYPRRPQAAFDAAAPGIEPERVSPFSALAKLKSR